MKNAILDVESFLNKNGMYLPKDSEGRKNTLDFRMDLLEEEFSETVLAYDKGEPDEIVDGMIDLIYIAIGTMSMAGVDINKAWDLVHNANMQKLPGLKAGRKNDNNSQDAMKPESWVAPDHSDNTGNL